MRNSSEFGDKYLEALAVCQNASRAIKYMWGLAEETQVAGVGKKKDIVVQFTWTLPKF